MAFPDYGPLPEIAQMTQDGFSQGSFLFRMFAGEISGSLALHYIGLTFALIGAVAIVFLKKFHNVKTIASWTFILVILLIGPKGGEPTGTGKRAGNSTFFINVPTNNNQNPGGYTFVDAYAPQAVIVDVMSKIHKAIYLGFFDISDPSKPRMRNLIEDLSVTQSRGMNKNLRERPDIKHEITVYTHFCGPSKDLAMPLFHKSVAGNFDYVKPINDYLRNIGVPPENRLASYQHSKEHTYGLQQKLFMAAFLPSMFDLYKTAYKKQTGVVYPPFAIAYEDENNFKDVLTNSGLSDTMLNIHTSNFENKNAHEIAAHEASYFDFLVKKDTLISQLGNGHFTAVGTPAMDTPAFSAIITDKKALAPKQDGRFLHEDPIEARLDRNPKTANISMNKRAWFLPDDAWINQIVEGDKGTTPVSLGFITPNLKEVYASRAEEHPGRLTNLSENPILNVVTNCAQLHTLVHNHMKEAIIFQNAWPAHGNTVTGGQNVSLVDIDGFNDITNPSVLNNYPYPQGDNLNSSQKSLNQLVQTQIAGFKFYNPDSDDEYQSMLDQSQNPAIADTAAESLRMGVIANVLNSALNNSGIYISRFNSEGAEQAGQMRSLTGDDDISRAIRSQASGDSIAENMPNLVSGPLQSFTSWVADIGTKVKAQFAGIGAVAFIRFLQLFIAISIFFLLMCTPILYMMGLIIPAHAPGVIITSLIAVVALKAIPIGFTLVDAVITNAMSGMDFIGVISETDKALMLYVTATAYTSITMITLFLLFKAGDTQAVMGQMAQLDSKANEIAETAGTIVKGLAGAAAAAATAGVGGSITGAIAAKKSGAAGGDAILKGLGSGTMQAGEIFGRRGLQSIPGAGGMLGEVLNAPREGYAQGQAMQELSSSQAKAKKAVPELKDEISNLEAQVNGSAGPVNPETAARLNAEIAEKRNKLKTNEEMASDSKSYVGHMMHAQHAKDLEKYRAPVAQSRKFSADKRAENAFEKTAASQGMSTDEARHKDMNAKAQNANDAVLGSSVQAQNLEMKGDVTLDGVEMSANAARAIQMGQLQADRSYKQANSDASETQRLAAVQDELKQQVKSTLATEVEGKGAKEVKSSVTYYETDDDGNVISSRVIPQDAMYDQAAGDLKKTLEGSAEFNASSPATRKNATELVAAKQLAEHSKGKYTDSDGNVKDFKLKLQPNVEEALHKTGDLDRITSSRNAKDLWIDPGSAAYDELRNLKGSDGKSMFNVPDGHSISLFNHHIQNDERAKQSAKDIMSDTNKQINSIKRNS